MEDNIGYIPNDIGLGMGMGLPPTDNQAELTKFVLDPEARKLYKHITKDLAISHLDREEINFINLNLQLLHMIMYVEEVEGDLENVKKVILQDVFSYVQVLRSKGGFERMAEITKKTESKAELSESKQKGRWI